MKTVYRDVVSAVLLSKDNKILMLKKNPDEGGVYVNAWHIPGGGIENGENKEQALCRELKEEIGLECVPEQLELLDDVGTGQSEKVVEEETVLCKMKFFVYLIKLADQNASAIKITLDPEHVEYRWFGQSELPNIQLTPPSQSLFRRLQWM